MNMRKLTGPRACQLFLLMGLPFAQQEIHRANDFDAVLVLGEVAFHGNDDLFVVVRDLA